MARKIDMEAAFARGVEAAASGYTTCPDWADFAPTLSAAQDADLAAEFARGHAAELADETTDENEAA